MRKITFSCSEANNKGKAQICTREWLNANLDSEDVLRHVASYRFWNNPEEKKSLPALVPQGYFPDGHRLKESAVASGLVMIDIDDHKEPRMGFDPRTHFEKYIQPLLSTTLSNVLMVYVTASGAGMRVIAKRTKCSNDVYAEQCELFGLLRGNLPYDKLDNSCCDLSRLSFVTTREDLLYINEDELFDGEVTEGFEADMNALEAKATLVETQAETGVAQAETCTALVKVGNNQQDESAENEPVVTLPIRSEVAAKISADGAYYGEVAYSDIVSELKRVDHLTLKKGTRNNDVYRLACQLRSICRSEEHLIKVLPYSGLSAGEVAETVHSACSSMVEGDEMDVVLQRVLALLCPEGDQQTTQEPAIPLHLPKAIKTIIDPVTPSHRPAMLMCALPMLGCLGTNLRFRYLEDEVHSLSFQTVLMAGQASGKSTMSKLHKLLLSKVIAQDEKNRAAMDDWKDDKQAAGESAGGPRCPHLPIRNLTPKATYPTFVDLMKYAKGKHLFICAPEIDAVENNRWFQNGSTPRLAFDNDMGGQDTKSVTAVSGYIPFYCNICMSGTPSAVTNRYRNAEDGLVSRTIFCTFPKGERGKKREPDHRRTPHNMQQISEIIDMLMNYGETNPKECEPVRLPKIEKAILNFYDMKGDLYNMTMDESIETFRTRSAVIGMRAGALAWLLEGKKETRAAINMALYVAEYTLYYQMKFFGQKLNESVIENDKVLTGKSLSSNDLIFVALADDFSNNDVTTLFRARGKQGTGVSQTGRRWEENHWVERVGRGQWRKTELGKQRAELLKQSMTFPSVGDNVAAEDSDEAVAV